MLWFLLQIVLALVIGGGAWNDSTNVTLVTRAEWGARPSKTINYMGTPVGVVFIHHTAMNECLTLDACSEEMRIIQNFHMDDRGWDDIGYNYLVGEDGCIYEGRGWDRIGAHTYGWNNVAVAFSIMGDYTDHLPNPAAISAVQAMINRGIKAGKITNDFKMYGHRDVRETECPGNELYKLIRMWPMYDDNRPIVKPTPIPYHEN